MSGVTVADDMAGKDATCPQCGKSFPTPARYAAAVVPEAASAIAGGTAAAGGDSSVIPQPAPGQHSPAPPPGYVPPTPPPPVAPSGFLSPPAPPAIHPPAGYTGSVGFSLSPKVIAWLPLVFLTLTFALTFFPWVGTYIGRAALYYQSPWSALWRDHNPNPALEKLAQETIITRDDLPRDWIMLPFLLILVLATVLAWAERLLQSTDPQKLPPPIAKIWPSRHMIIAGLSVAIVVLILFQSLRGFALERSVRQVVRNNPELVKERKAAEDAGSEWKKAMVDYREEQDLLRFNLSRTTWMHLGVLFSSLAALSALGYITLEKRGDKPPPKVMLHY